MVKARRLHGGWIAFAIICLIAVIVAGVMMYIAWDHNPQLAFHEDGIIHWNAWLGVGVSWFFAIAGIPCLGAITAAIFVFVRRRI